MPSLIVTGYPSSGKTTVSKMLKDRALQHDAIKDVVIINEETDCPDWTKQECYETPIAEKKTRAALKSAFDRAVATSNKKTLVILDSLDYIKGFRYELHCISKAAGERHGILWVLNNASVVEEWNENRPAEKKEREAYSRELLLELIQRYEPPDERNRWDKPMYSVDVAPTGNVDSKSEAVNNSVYNMHALGESLAGGPATQTNAISTPIETANLVKKKSAFSRTKRKSPVPSVTDEIAKGTINTTPLAVTQQPEKMIVHAGSQDTYMVQESQTKPLEVQLDDILNAFLSSQELKQGASTQQHTAVNTNVLSDMDAVTTRLVSAISSSQATHTGGKLQVSFGGSTYAIECPRMAALPELRRLRRQYLQWASTHPPDDTSGKGISESFLNYLEDQLT